MENQYSPEAIRRLADVIEKSGRKDILSVAYYSHKGKWEIQCMDVSDIYTDIVPRDSKYFPAELSCEIDGFDFISLVSPKELAELEKKNG